MPNTIDRRAFLSRSAWTALGVVAATGAGSSILEACGSSGSSSASGSSGGKLGTVPFQLSWIKNVEFAGTYIADTQNLYEKEGLAGVDIITGGPTVSTEPVVVSGKALIGVTSPDFTAAAVTKGAPLVIVGSQYQKNPFAVMSLASKPIKTPQEMIGKSIGVQATNETIWNSFLKANNIDASKVHKVPVQFDPTPLANGQVDGWFSFVTNEPNLLKVKGVNTYVMPLEDFGYKMFNECYVVRKDSLTGDKRKQLAAFLKGEILGWQQQLANPALGAHLTVTKYGKSLGLDEHEQTLEGQAQNDLIVNDYTKAHGIFQMPPDQQQASVQTMALGGIKADAKTLFTNDLLDEIYGGKATLS